MLLFNIVLFSYPNVLDLQEKIEKCIKENNGLQKENQRMTDEFNSQRAKWKVLLLQKEGNFS